MPMVHLNQDYRPTSQDSTLPRARMAPVATTLLAALLAPSCTDRVGEVERSLREEMVRAVAAADERAEERTEARLLAQAQTFERIIEDQVQLRVNLLLPGLVDEKLHKMREGIRTEISASVAILQRDVSRSVTDAMVSRELDRLVGPAEASLRISANYRNAARIRQMERATVRIEATDSVGSGTIVYSGRYGDLGRATIILTAYHVYRTAVEDEKKLEVEGVPVAIYTGSAEPEQVKAKLLKGDAMHDIALLLVVGERPRIDPVAPVLPPEHIGKLSVGTQVSTCGSPAGIDPIFSDGFIAKLDCSIPARDEHGMTLPKETNYYMINAPTWFGVSGGGAWYFVDNGPEQIPFGFLLGAFSKILTVRGQAIPYIGYFADPVAVNQLYADAGLQIDLSTWKLTVADGKIDLPGVQRR